MSDWGLGEVTGIRWMLATGGRALHRSEVNKERSMNLETPASNV